MDRVQAVLWIVDRANWDTVVGDAVDVVVAEPKMLVIDEEEWAGKEA